MPALYALAQHEALNDLQTLLRAVALPECIRELYDSTTCSQQPSATVRAFACTQAKRLFGMPLAKSRRTVLTSQPVAVSQLGSATSASLLTVRDSTCWASSLVMKTSPRANSSRSALTRTGSCAASLHLMICKQPGCSVASRRTPRRNLPRKCLKLALLSRSQASERFRHGNCPLAERPQRKVTPNAPSNIPPMGAKKLLRAAASRHRVGSCAANGAG